MKMSKSFSLESNNLSEFLSLCENNDLNANAVVETLIKEWLKEQRLQKVDMIVCDICASKYSSVLNACPKCEEQKIKNKELLIRKRDEDFRAAEMEKLNMDLIEMHHRKEYLMKHLILGQAQQCEVDMVDEQIKRTTDRIEEMKRV